MVAPQQRCECLTRWREDERIAHRDAAAVGFRETPVANATDDAGTHRIRSHAIAGDVNFFYPAVLADGELDFDFSRQARIAFQLPLIASLDHAHT